MEKNGHEKITAFDTLFTTNHIQMLKILMPYLEPPMQKQMAVYIKYLELRYAMSCLDSHPHELYGCAGGHNNPLGGSGPFAKEEFHIGKICSELIPYCTDEEKQKVEQLSGLFRSMEMYKEMSQTFEAMKEFMPDFSPDFLSGFMQNQIDQSKLQFLQMLVFESKNLTKEQMLPFLLSVAQKGKNSNISFDDREIELIVAALRKYASPEEADKINKVMAMKKKR